MIFELLVLVLTASVSISAYSLSWEDCGTKVKVHALRISGCTKQPCIFTSGEEYRLEVDATSVNGSKSLPYWVRANNIFDYDVSEGDACQHLVRGSTCPITKEGQPINFSKTFVIQFPAVPTLRVFQATVTTEMIDESGRMLLCAKMEVEVKRKDTESSIFGIFDIWGLEI